VAKSAVVTMQTMRLYTLSVSFTFDAPAVSALLCAHAFVCSIEPF
jgi:hypothetical protein